MIIKALRNNVLPQFILLLPFSLALWGKAFFDCGFARWDIWLAWVWILGCAVGFGLILSHYNLSRNPGFLSLVFLCLAAAYNERAFTSELWFYPLALLTLYETLNIYGKDRSYPAIFNMAFFWSLITVLQPELFFTLPCIFVILIAYSLNNHREWLCSIFGITSAYLLLFAFHFLFPEQISLPLWSRMQVFGLPSFGIENLFPLLLTVLCAFISMLSVLAFRHYMQDLEMSERRKSQALVWMFVYFLLFTLITDNPASTRLFLIFPLAFFSTRFLLKAKKGLLPDLCLLLIMALSLLCAYR